MNCLLCQQCGDHSESIFKVINTYIHDNSGVVHETEIAHQISVLLKTEKNITMSRADILTHMREHMTNQRVVVDNMLRDLIDISKITRKAALQCNTVDQEDDSSSLNPKMLTLHLKLVDQITCLYRMKQ